jgi:hypothetical protein
VSQQISELENILRQQVAEYRKLLAQVVRHEAAMKLFDLRVMEDAGRQQEESRVRITMLDQRRRSVVLQLARGTDFQGEPTLRKLAAMFPARAEALMHLRAELKGLIEQLATRTHVSGKVAGAVLGHLNTIVRLLAGVVERAGLYTKQGVPKLSSRIGVMNAVG